MSYIISIKEKLIHIDWYAVLCEADLLALRREIPERAMHLGFSPNILHTFDRVTACTLQPISALDHSLKRKAMAIPVRTKCASVATNEAIFKYAKLFQELNRNPNLDMQIFSSEAEALEWLSA